MITSVLHAILCITRYFVNNPFIFRAIRLSVMGIVKAFNTDAPQATSSQIEITMYLALQDKGVFRSTDAGAQWHPLNKGLTGKRIYTIALIQNAVFVGTSDGLYALNSDIWEPVLVDTPKIK